MSKRTLSIYCNSQNSWKSKQNDTSKKTSTTKHHVNANNKIENGGKIWEDTPTTNTWYRFVETEGQKLVAFDGSLIHKRNENLESFSIKFKNQSPWGSEEIGQEKGKGGVRYAIKETLQFWDLDSSNFHLNLEDKLRQSKTSYNCKKLKLHYQTAIKMATTAPIDLTGYIKYTEELGTNEALPMSTVT